MTNIDLLVKTEDFEGPLDLFLHLIDNKKIDISKIYISEIIDEYLSIITKETEQNLKIKIEFLAMATELLEIKAYSILNEDKKIEKEQDLEKRILEYKVIKEIAEEFSKREIEYNIPYIVKGNKTKEQDNIYYSLEDLTLNNIFEIFNTLINKVEIKENMKINVVDTFTTTDALFEIEKEFVKNNELTFSSLMKGNFSKGRIVCFFLAILDLFKEGSIDITLSDNDFIIRKEAYV
ncbi:segregation and condensation protein A [Streptobacillus moniliformis]|uniref:segregation and condensation protein A n=1 Tax=Streptobacillus moniliformis TaxID=34105 RepID=UPI0009C19E82|nr:segregation/condensation protein A [Streptobacillus moniliformis]QXW65978.1 segregation/condensation protein A [Streptobacillus moniliformis]